MVKYRYDVRCFKYPSNLKIQLYRNKNHLTIKNWNGVIREADEEQVDFDVIDNRLLVVKVLLIGLNIEI